MPKLNWFLVLINVAFVALNVWMWSLTGHSYSLAVAAINVVAAIFCGWSGVQVQRLRRS